jgi:CRISPR-associated protein Csm4
MALYTLTLCAPLHLGEFIGIGREAALEWIPSDSLFAAIVAAWAQTGVDVDAALNGKQSPFTLTSAFPWAAGVRFYPCPPRLPSLVVNAFAAHNLDSKALKKIRWLSQQVLDGLREGKSPAPEFLHNGGIWLTANEGQQIETALQPRAGEPVRLWTQQIVPRVTVDRTSNASNLFHSGRVLFAPGCGLWFAARGDTALIEPALNYLRDAGLGGLRSIGHGAFTYEATTAELPAADGRPAFLLSRYAPQTDDELRGLQDGSSTYGLVRVGGWCEDPNGNHWRRRAVRLVAEGALLPAGARGALVNVRPEKVEWAGPVRPVYRCGLAFAIPADCLWEGGAA